MKVRGLEISKISAMHYFKLVFRILLFLGALIMYIISRIQGSEVLFTPVEDKYPILIWIICAVFIVEMALRFFPSEIESMGCRKQFQKEYRPAPGNPEPVNQSTKTTLLVALVWCGLNAIFGILHLCGVIDYGIMFLLCLAYSVCDIICILFFCPFQTWFMKNKCCGSCRIYNWDYAMMFTPLLFVKHFYTWMLLGLALALLIHWEIIFYRHPERFSETTNLSLRCENCPEKLCHHKKQLQRFLKENPQLRKLASIADKKRS